MALQALAGLLPETLRSSSALAGVAFAILAIAGAVIFYLGYPRPIPGIPYNKDAAKRWLGDVPSFQKHFRATGEGWDWMALQCEKLNSRQSFGQAVRLH